MSESLHSEYISKADQILDKMMQEGWFPSVQPPNGQPNQSSTIGWEQLLKEEGIALAPIQLPPIRWEEKLKKDGVILESTNVEDSPIPAYRVSGSYYNTKSEFLIKKVFGVSSLAQAQINDPKVVSWRLLEENETDGKKWRVIEQTNSMGWPIWPRHTVFVQVRYDLEDSTYLVGFSVDHPNASILNDHVKSDIKFSVYKYSQGTYNHAHVSRITLIDPKGYIPTALIKAYSGKMVDLFVSWKNDF